MTLEAKVNGPNISEIDNQLQDKIEAIHLYQEDLQDLK